MLPRRPSDRPNALTARSWPLVALLAAAAVGPAGAATVTWSDAAGGSWHDASNWSPAIVPGPGDDVLIDLAGTYVVALAAEASVASLGLGGSSGLQELSTAGRTLTLAAASTVGANGRLNLSGGTLTGGGDLSVQGQMLWTGGTMSGTGTTRIETGGLLTIGGIGTAILRGGRTLSNAGTTEWTSTTSFVLDDETTSLLNELGGTFDVRNDESMIDGCCGGFATFTNEGVVRKSLGAATTTIDVPFVSPGDLDVQSGVLRINAGGSLAGMGTVASSAELRFTGGTTTWMAGAAFGGSGPTVVAGATVSVDAAVNAALLELASGTLRGTGTLGVTGHLDWSGGSMIDAGTTRIEAGASLAIRGSGLKTLDGGRQLVNLGTATWEGTGDLNVDAAGTSIVNEVGATFDIRNDEPILDACCDGLGEFVNHGLLVKSMGTLSTTVVDIPVTSEGTIDVQQGALALDRSSTLSSSVTVSDGAELRFSAGTHQLTGGADLSGAGLHVLAGGTLSVEAAVGVDRFRQSSGTLDGAGIFTVRQEATWSGGTAKGTGTLRVAAAASLSIDGSALKTLDGGRQLVNLGTTTWTGTGNLNADGAATAIRNEAGATFDIRNDESILDACCDGIPQFVNHGALVKSLGTLSTTVIDVPLISDAGVDVLQGALALSGGSSLSAPVTVADGAELRFTAGAHELLAGAELAGDGLHVLSGGTLTVSGSVGADRFTQSGGTLAGTGTLAVLQQGSWTGGSQVGAGTTRLEMGATLELAGAAQKTLDDGRQLDLRGTATWTGTGNLSLDGGTTAIIVAVGGLLDVQNDELVFDACCAGSLAQVQVEGVLRKSAGEGTTGLSIALSGAGTIDVQEGTLALTAGSSDLTGSVVLAADTELSLSGGAHEWSGGLAVMGPGTAVLSGGTLTIRESTSADGLRISGGTRDGPGSLSVKRELHWTGGQLASVGTTRVDAGASLVIDGAASRTLDAGHQLVNAGSATWTGTGPLSFDDAPTELRNEPGATFDLQADASAVDACCAAVGRIRNEGTWIKSAGASSTLGVPFVNVGHVDVQSGEIALTGGGEQSGSASIAAGAQLRFAGGTHDWQAGFAVTGTGPAAITAGTVSLSGDATAETVAVSGGERAGPGRLSVTGSLAWTGGILGEAGWTRIEPGAALAIDGAASKRLDGGHLLEVAGVATWAGTGPLGLDGDATRLRVAPGGLFDLLGDASAIDSCCGGLGSLLNDGTWRKSSLGTSRMSVPFVSTGMTEVLQGVLRLSSGGSQSGTATVAAGAELLHDGGVHAWVDGASFIGPGPTRIGGGSVAVGGTVAAAAFSMSGGTLEGDGLLSLTGPATWTGGVMTGSGTTRVVAGASVSVEGVASATVAGSRRFEVAGQLTWPGPGHLLLDGDATRLHVLAGGVLEAQFDGVLGDACCGGLASVLNEGEVVKSAGSGVTSISLPFENAGSVSVESGTLRVNTPYLQSSGVTTVAAATVLDAISGLDLQGGLVAGSGTIQGAVTNGGGIVAPGLSPGRLQLTGSYTQEAGGTLRVQVGGPDPGTQHDQLAVAGVASLDGVLEAELIDGHVPGLGESFTALTFASRTGEFAEVVSPVFDGRELRAVHGASAVQLVASFVPPPIVELLEALNDPTAGATTIDILVRAGGQVDVQGWEAAFDAVDGAPDATGSFGAPALDVEEVVSIELGALAAGVHELLLRVLDGNGQPSPWASVDFVVSSGQLPVVLVQGWDVQAPGAHPARLHAWMSRLEDLGVPAVVADGQDAWAPANVNADALAAAVAEVLAAEDAALVDLLAFDQGGLVVRDYLDRHGSDAVRRAVLVASPHRGSFVADELYLALLEAAEAGSTAAQDRLAADRALAQRTTEGAALFDAAHRRVDELGGVDLVLLAARRPPGDTDDVLEVSSALGLLGANVATDLFETVTVDPPLHAALLEDEAFFADHVAPALGLAVVEPTALGAAGRGASRLGLARLVRLSVDLLPGVGGKFTGAVQVDDADAVTLQVFDVQGAVDLTVTTPGGKVLTPAAVAADPNVTLESWSASGELSAATLSIADPEPGSYAIDVGAAAPFGKVSQASPLQAGAATDQGLYAPGQDVTVELSIAGGVESAAATADLQGPGGKVSVPVADDGVGADAIAGDGVFTGVATLSGDAPGGTYSLGGKLTGTTDAGSAYDRDATSLFSVSSGGVAAPAGFAASLQGSGGSGLATSLDLDFELDVATAGTYQVSGKLTDPTGGFAGDATVLLSDQPAGPAALTLPFPATALAASGQSGKFTLSELTVLDVSDGQTVALQALDVFETQDIDLALVEQDGRPRFRFVEPSADTPASTTDVTLRWEDADPDDDATISLFLDDDGEGFDGVPIPGAGALSEDDPVDAFVLDVSGLEVGSHRVHGRITDGTTSSQVYATGRIRVGLDRDGDGIPDAIEVAVGLDPDRHDAGADGDADGLTNAEEVARGTAPTLPDTDGGGELDGREVEFGRDPLVPGDDVSTEGRSIGDVAPRGTGNAALDVSDVVLGLRLVVRLEEADAVELILADVAPNEVVARPGDVDLCVKLGDGRLDVADVVAMLRGAVRLCAIVESLP